MEYTLPQIRLFLAAIAREEADAAADRINEGFIAAQCNGKAVKAATKKLRGE